MKYLYTLCMTFWSLYIFGQISGTVKDALNGEVLIGVNVSIMENDGIGTISDIDGKFEINAQVGQTLVFSYVGYSNFEYLIQSQESITINLEEASELLEEVVVIGYGAVQKEDLTGVVQKVDEEDFIQGSLSSPEKLLNGKVAGLQIQNNGEPGGGTNLVLRGGAGLSTNTSPLIVIDGVPLDTRDIAGARNIYNFVNASDVENISILKDASAAAIYGSRGANGVVMITTKSGQSGKLKVEYNGNANVSIFSGSTNILSPNNFRNAISAKAPQELEFLGDVNTVWLDEVLQNASSTEHNISFSGGTEKTKFRIGAGYINANGVLITSKHETQSISGSVSTSLFNDKLRISVKSKTGISNDRFTPDVIGSALSFDPTRPVLDPDSQYGGYFQWNDPLATKNPVSTLELTEETGKTLRSLNNIKLDLDLPIEGLTATSSIAYDYINGEKRNYRDPLLRDSESFERGGYLFDEEFRNYSLLLEHYLTYKLDLGKLHKLSLTAGHSWQEFDQENRWTEGNGLELQDDGSYLATVDVLPDSFLVQNRLISFFGRANLNLSEKYLITASIRRDGSTRFGPDNKWGLFPAVAVAWRILEEDFLQGLNNTFSNLKLRISYGVTGNENIDDFLFNTFYEYSADDSRYQFGNQFINTLRGSGVDPGIKWEETTSINLGLDFGFANNRINGSLEFYRKNTNDLLYTIAVPGFTNLADRILTNIGAIENNGIELTLNAVVIDKKDFDWEVDFNISRNTNQITSLDNTNDPNFMGYEDGTISGDVGQTIQVLRVGESIETFLTYQHILGDNGLPRTDTEDFNGDGLISDLDIYEDINGDGIINENDLVINQTALPDVMLGFSTAFSYKKWDLSAVFRAQIGNYVYNNVASAFGYFDRLTERKTNNIDESAFIVDFNDRQLKSDYYIEDASFLRLDNLSLGYNFGNLGAISNLRISFTGSNLLTITNYSGIDPELPQFNKGIDNNIYPISRNFLLGVKAQF